MVRLGKKPVVVGNVEADAGDEPFRGSAPGTLDWALVWKPLHDKDEISPFSTPLMGGVTDWVQSDSTPVCPECDEMMDFLVKLPNHREAFNVVEFEGVVYAHACPNCDIVATQFQTS
jgi:hypothetical protein